jgi:hypothetical protein
MKITSLMPAFKIDYIMESIYSVALQSMPVNNLIISDDSKNDEVINYLKTKNLELLFPKLDISIVSGPKDGPWSNIKYLLSLLSDEVDLFHVMMDDDLIYPDFMRKHSLLHQEVTPMITVSKRWVLHKTGLPIGVPYIPDYIYKNNIIRNFFVY